MIKIYYLSSCSTCTRIINELDLKNKKIEFQDIKTEKISAIQLTEMKKLAGSYEALFSKIAMKYRALGLSIFLHKGKEKWRQYSCFGKH